MATPAKKILVKEEGSRRSSPVVPSQPVAWKVIGWFGLLLAVIGAVDAALHWYPPAFNSPEWEFGTVATSVGALPLPTIGLAALLGSFVARGVRWGMITMAVVLLALGLAVLAAYGLFLLDVPLALNAATGPAATALKKAIVRTTVMGPGFALAYIWASIVVLRHLSRRVERA
ncbi:MAG: hypothetical protein PVJ02_19140 [Gemmatimonadota bacterium]|jgi:hypothetical protein